MKKYDDRLGALRVIAALAVIGIHITSGYVLENDFGFVMNQFFRFAVPLFIVMSGFVLFQTDLGKQKSMGAFLIGRVQKILVPYFLWLFIYMVFEARHNIGSILRKEFAVAFFKNALLGYDHLYFIIIIFQLYLIYPLLKSCFQRNWDHAVLIAAFLLTGYFQICSYLLNWGITYIPMRYYDYYSIVFPTWIFFFVLGMYCVGRIHIIKGNHLMHAVVTWIVSLGVVITESKINKSFASSMKPTIIIYTILSFVSFYLFLEDIEHLPNSIKNILRWLSDQSFIIYLSHILFLKLLKSYAKILEFHNLWQGTQGMILLYTATTISAVVFSYIVSYTPMCTLLGGVRARKQAKHKNFLETVKA